MNLRSAKRMKIVLILRGTAALAAAIWSKHKSVINMTHTVWLIFIFHCHLLYYLRRNRIFFMLTSYYRYQNDFFCIKLWHSSNFKSDTWIKSKNFRIITFYDQKTGPESGLPILLRIIMWHNLCHQHRSQQRWQKFYSFYFRWKIMVSGELLIGLKRNWKDFLVTWTFNLFEVVYVSSARRKFLRGRIWI